MYLKLNLRQPSFQALVDGNYGADKSSDQSSPRNPVTLCPDYLVSPGQAGKENYQERPSGNKDVRRHKNPKHAIILVTLSSV